MGYAEGVSSPAASAMDELLSSIRILDSGDVPLRKRYIYTDGRAEEFFKLRSRKMRVVKKVFKRCFLVG
jgi:hypothetical protein